MSNTAFLGIKNKWVQQTWFWFGKKSRIVFTNNNFPTFSSNHATFWKFSVLFKQSQISVAQKSTFSVMVHFWPCFFLSFLCFCGDVHYSLFCFPNAVDTERQLFQLVCPHNIFDLDYFWHTLCIFQKEINILCRTWYRPTYSDTKCKEKMRGLCTRLVCTLH